jgi:hypothetical protein
MVERAVGDTPTTPEINKRPEKSSRDPVSECGPAARRPLPAAGPRSRSVLPPSSVVHLQRLVGNRGVVGALGGRGAEAVRTERPATLFDSLPPIAVQRCGGGACHCGGWSGGAAGSDKSEEQDDRPVQRSAAGPCALQRDFLGDAWDAVKEAGPAVAEAARLAATVATNPSSLPLVMSAIAWEKIPEQFKGPIVDDILRACLAAARNVSIPGVPGVPIGTILQHVAIGALERALSYPTGMKVQVANRMAKIVLNPSADFSIGFLKGLVSGLWDGLTGPFVLLWDLAKIGYEIQAAEMRFLSTMAHAESRKQFGAQVKAAIDAVEPRVAQAIAQLTGGKTNPAVILSMVEQLVNAALKGVESLGASLSDALLKFLNRPDDTLGEGVGYVAGTVTFEVLLLVLTEGGYTAIKEAVQGLRVVVRAVEVGAQAWEALGPVRMALARFKEFAAANRALAPLVESLEEVFSLLVKFLKMSYGLDGAAGKAGERAVAGAERAASREIRVAETAMGETHEITLLADGRLIRCSDRCLQMAQSVSERASALLGESGKPLITEAEVIAKDARALKAKETLTEAERAEQEAALLKRAEDLERRTAAAEREALDRLTKPTEASMANCHQMMRDGGGASQLKQYESEVERLDGEIKKATDLLNDPDPEIRQMAAQEYGELRTQAADLESRIRERRPLAPGEVPATSTTHLQSNRKMVGEGGVRTTSTTVMPDEGIGFRLDVENPNPGVRAGQLHLQPSGPNETRKWIYNFNNNTWVPVAKTPEMPARIAEQAANDPAVARAIARAKQYLGVP